MDVWVAIISPETADQAIVGVFTTEEQALTVAERVSPGDADVDHFVLNETVDWVRGYEYERANQEE
ncbi:MAG TPA: hypothetical protein VGL57_14790 [Solirubrobacteraceae bacterium]|jgi:hypothetical protein